MPVERHRYQIQGDEDKDKWYQVILEPRGSWIERSCTCRDHLWKDKDCQHIRRALECYVMGF